MGIGAMCLSFALHFVILYVEIMATVFQVTPLSVAQWITVMKFSLPVILLDELLKLVATQLLQHHPYHQKTNNINYWPPPPSAAPTTATTSAFNLVRMRLSRSHCSLPDAYSSSAIQTHRPLLIPPNCIS